jgi:hypothetical protein
MKTKDEVVNEFRDTLTQHSEVLILCGVKPKEITDYAWEPYKVANVRRAHKYMSEIMYPEVDRLFKSMFHHTKDSMKSLMQMSPRHGDIKIFKEKAKSVQTVWNNRPQFPDDKGRWW